MQLTPVQIVEIAETVISDAKKLAAAIEAGMAKLNAHNASKGATAVNAGPLSVALGCANTVSEQLQRHINDNTPPATPPAA